MGRSIYVLLTAACLILLPAVLARAQQPGQSFRDCSECPQMVVVPAGSFLMGAGVSDKAEIINEFKTFLQKLEAFVKEREVSGDKEALEFTKVLLKGMRDFQDEYKNRLDAMLEGPQHKVSIAQSFAVGKFEITFDEWDACVVVGACPPALDGNTGLFGFGREEGWGRGKRPVINVSWNAITQQYLPWLSRKAGKTYRLLTEAEWEYAARGGTTTLYAFGNTISKSQANFNDFTSKDHSSARPLSVGSFMPNAFGLHEMHGNVWEWVQDCWNNNYNDAPVDGSVRTDGDCTRHVLRGGGYADIIPLSSGLRSAARKKGEIDSSSDIGFRVAVSLVN